MQHEKLGVAQCELRVGASLIISELDFKNAGGESLDDGSDLATDQALLWYIGGEGDDIKWLNGGRHGFSRGLL